MRIKKQTGGLSMSSSIGGYPFPSRFPKTPRSKETKEKQVAIVVAVAVITLSIYKCSAYMQADK